jgi:hypothetical protein
MRTAGIVQAAASSEAVVIRRVANTDALDDHSWFQAHPERLFRARAGDGGIWLIRRRPQGAGPDVYLRTLSRTSPPTDASDGALAVAWYTAAYPSWPPERVRKAARRALKRERP